LLFFEGDRLLQPDQERSFLVDIEIQESSTQGGRRGVAGHRFLV
jgi:hypothetical protein